MTGTAASYDVLMGDDYASTSYAGRDLTARLREQVGFAPASSDQGVPLKDISQLLGHSSTAVTELVYRKQIRPVLQLGTTTMDQVFGDRDRQR